MQKIDGAQSRGQMVIIVAPPAANIRIVRAEASEVVAFTSSEEFDRWIVRQPVSATIRDDVATALHEVGGVESTFPRGLRAAIEKLSDARTVPDLADIESTATSRRSFYRMWCARIRETPSAFLRRVRAMHARRLLAGGMSRKEAALQAGFSSVDQMRRHVGPKSPE